MRTSTRSHRPVSLRTASVRHLVSQLQPKGLPVPPPKPLVASAELLPCLTVVEKVLAAVSLARPEPYKDGLRRRVSFLAETLETQVEECGMKLDDTLFVLRRLGVKHSLVYDRLGDVCAYDFYVKTDAAGKLKAPLDTRVLDFLDH